VALGRIPFVHPPQVALEAGLGDETGECHLVERRRCDAGDAQPPVDAAR
jgi:hypothetical protein